MSRFVRSLIVLTLLCSFLLTLPFIQRVHASSGTFTQYTYNGSAGSRPYYVYTPANYQVGTAVPLIVMLHGCTQTPTDFANGTQMNALADQNQFIVVYPQQTSTYNSLSCWNWFLTADQARGSGEPAIIAGIVQTVEQTTSQWTIDTNRVYAAGMSAGAAMAVIMGATYPDIFAAIGVHSGLEYQAATSQTAATMALSQGGPDPTTQGQAAYNAMGSAARVVPTIDFQGQSDYTVYPVNGDQVIKQWMQTDHLASNNTYNASFGSPATTTSGQVPGGYSYTIQTWKDSSGSEIEEYWKINSMGHAWSGGSSSGSYTDPKGPSATNALYTFFMNHPMHPGSITPTPGITPTATATPTQPPTPTPTPNGTSCQVHYSVVSQWSGSFQAGFIITNMGTTAINGWTLRFSFANGQMVTLSWNGNFSQSGSVVTVTNTSINGSIPSGGSPSVEPGFQATWSGTNSPPTAFTLNGTACSVV
ncbi:MAG: PHB depolymerase family esterase [Ktedonobacteraceae bacterium]|nr:PHB depolymerase family esterase [Ktedonobacteraceae bacterium]